MAFVPDFDQDVFISYKAGAQWIIDQLKTKQANLGAFPVLGNALGSFGEPLAEQEAAAVAAEVPGEGFTNQGPDDSP